MDYLIYGAGGHANVIAAMVRKNGDNIHGFFDDKQGGYDVTVAPGAKLIIGIGNNAVREAIVGRVTHAFGILVHTQASVAETVEIGEGTVILANAVVQVNAKIGRHVIINAGAVVDHDAVLEDYVHVAPGAYIGGGAVVKKGAVIGPNAVVMRNVVIAEKMEIPPLTLQA